jgi:uncharacterized membrane protein (UPF0127 family)
VVRTRRGLRLVNRSRDIVIADHVELAMSFWARAKGLIGRRTLPDGFALVIRPCNAIHTLFMTIPIDVVHVDGNGHVIAVLREVKPWRVGPIVLKSASVIELPAGTSNATGMQLGDRVELIGSYSWSIRTIATGHPLS